MLGNQCNRFFAFYTSFAGTRMTHPLLVSDCTRCNAVREPAALSLTAQPSMLEQPQ